MAKISPESEPSRFFTWNTCGPEAEPRVRGGGGGAAEAEKGGGTSARGDSTRVRPLSFPSSVRLCPPRSRRPLRQPVRARNGRAGRGGAEQSGAGRGPGGGDGGKKRSGRGATHLAVTALANDLENVKVHGAELALAVVAGGLRGNLALAVRRGHRLHHRHALAGHVRPTEGRERERKKRVRKRERAITPAGRSVGRPGRLAGGRTRRRSAR